MAEETPENPAPEAPEGAAAETPPENDIAAAVAEGSGPQSHGPSGEPAPETPPTAETPPQTPTETPPAAETRPFLESVQALGDDYAQITDPEAAQARLLQDIEANRGQMAEIQAQVEQAQRDRDEFQAFLQSPEYQGYRQWQQEQAAPAQPGPQTSAEPEEVRFLPQSGVDASMLGHFTQQNPETGERDWKRDASGAILAPAEFRNAVQEEEFARQRWAQGLVNNPDETLTPVIDRRAEMAAERVVERVMQQQGVMGFVQDVHDQHQDWMFAKDQSGQIIQDFDPVSGAMKPRYTPQGQAVNRYLQEATAMGIADPRAKWKYATEKAHYDILRANAGQPATPETPAAPAAPETPATPQPTPAEQRRRTRRRAPGATVQPQGNGSTPQPTNPNDLPQTTRPLGTADIFAEELSREGLKIENAHEILRDRTA